MSNIVVSEEQILNAEECRVIQRTNLRNQGVGCADDEDMRSLVGKTSSIQGWKAIANKSISGNLYDDEMTGSTFITSLFQSTPIQKVAFTELTNITTSLFRYCTSLEDIYVPKATNGGADCIGGCTSLKRFIAPRKNSSVINGTAINTNTIKIVDWGESSQINGQNAMQNGGSFNLVLRKSDSIVTLDNVSRFSGSTPRIYVPSSLISAYENATNWSALSGVTFIALEGSRYESLDWANDYVKDIRFSFSTCTLDGNAIDVLDNETVAIFKHTENISHCYENGVELQDTDLVKGKTLTSTI